MSDIEERLSKLEEEQDLIQQKLDLLLEPRSTFNVNDYMKRNGIRDLPGGG
jgi:hypothetical protein